MGEWTKAGRQRVFIHQLPLLLWLVLLWMLLWGSFSWLNLVTGAILAILITRVFYLPPIELSGRFNLWWALVFAVHFAWDLLRASVSVAWIAVDPRSIPRSSIVAVRLHTRSDLIMTLISVAISLVPGSLVVEADRVRSVLYVHALNTKNLDEVAKARDIVHGVERRLVKALGSREDIKRVEEGRPLS